MAGGRNNAVSAAPRVPPLVEWLHSYPKLDQALKDCSQRFVAGLGTESIRDAPRLCVELQEAFWFYLDHLLAASKKDLPKLNQVNFFHLILESSDLLKSVYDSPQARQRLMKDWRDYVKKVPFKGAVLLNEQLDKCFMVEPWKGDKATGDKWTFPRGKMNAGESEEECAIREVWEETGLDISGRIDAHQFVSADVYGSGCAMKLFVVPGLPERDGTEHSNKETGRVGWIQLARLPGWDDTAHSEVGTLRFFCVGPFVPGIKRWLQNRRAQAGSVSAYSSLQIGPPPGLPAPGSYRGQAGQAHEPKKRLEVVGAQAPVEPRASFLQGAAPLVLDLRKVMKEFDRCWGGNSKPGHAVGSKASKGRGRG